MALAEVAPHVRAHFTHALVQHVADLSHIRVLHVKGPALHRELLGRDGEGNPVPRRSSDADVLVAPTDAERLLVTLEHYGATTITSFETGSPFEHAVTLKFDQLGYCDVHRYFPGIERDAAEAFDILWRTRIATDIAHRPCTTPSLTAQRLVLLLHAARSIGHDHDKEAAWGRASAVERDEVRELARVLHAEVALAAALGELDRFRGTPTYDLWNQFSRNPAHSRTAEWVARIRAAPTLGRKLALVRRSLRLNTDHLAMELGHPPTREEIRRAQRRRLRRAWGELTGRGQGGHRP